MSRIGEVSSCPIERIKDSKTGREIWKMTPDGFNNVAAYMYINSFSEDEKYLFFTSDRTGAWEMYRQTVLTGEVVQLTELPRKTAEKNKDPLRGNMNPATNELYVFSGSQIHAIHLESLQSRQVADLSTLEGVASAGNDVHFSHDGKYGIAFTAMKDGHVGIARVDTVTGAAEQVFIRPEERMQHLQYVKSGYDLISFSAAPDHQQEWDTEPMHRARTYLLDLSDNSVIPILVTPPPCTATHEYWGPTGDRLYYHKKTRPDWLPTWLCVLDRHTMVTREIFRTDEYKLGHSYIDRDETFIISDVQNANDNPLIKVDIESGESEILCWPNSTVKDSHLSHVHPSISPKSTYAIYTTDKSGESQVYLVPLDQGKGIKG